MPVVGDSAARYWKVTIWLREQTASGLKVVVGKQYDVSINGFGLSDLLKLGEYVVGTTHISEQYALALQNIVSNGDIFKEKLLVRAGNVVIRDQAVRVLGDYWNYQQQNVSGLVAGMTANMLETTASNVTSGGSKRRFSGVVRWL